MAERAAGELELQRRWAESRWPIPFLHPSDSGAVRVIAPGRWNRGPGPDFRGAHILDQEGRARRGDVELHLRAGDWIQHGHADDPAFQDILLHVVEWNGQGRHRARTTNERIPAATPLPQPVHCDPSSLPCDGISTRAGSSAVEARLQQIAQRRFLRKTAELRALAVPPGPGSSNDRRSLLAVARALGQPHNTERSLGAARRALDGADRWDAVSVQIGAAGWRPGRGALGSPEGLADILMILLRRWTAADSAPWLVFQELSKLPRREASGNLRIAGKLGRGRATQLLADAVYPLTNAWHQWSQLPGARYLRTDELRARIDGADRSESSGFVWRHPHTQALLELERTRCRHWACRICPLAALDRRSLDAGREDFGT